MNHRQRVAMALNHQTPDRCPMQVSFTPEFARRLRADLGLGADESHNPHGGGNTYELERLIDEDLILTSVGWANSYYQTPSEYTDEWGVGWKSIGYQNSVRSGSLHRVCPSPPGRRPGDPGLHPARSLPPGAVP